MDAPVKDVNKWIVTITVMLPTIMEIVDTSVANVALPHMQGSLNAGTDEITWVLTSYLVSNAVVLPMTGWLSRHFGRKRFLISCITLFTMASLLCGAAPNLASLIFFRVLQGAAGGALIPSSQAILLETFPPHERGMANAIFGVGAMFGPIIGPALGGWITDNLNWRWIFYINIPLGIIAVIMAVSFIFDPPYLRRARVAIDWWGLVLLTVGLGALQIVLDKGQQDDWFNSSFILSCSILSALALIALVYVELKHEHPIINLRLFKDVSFSAGNFVMFMLGFGLYSSIVLIPLFLQTLMGYDATLAGMVLAPGGLATLITMPFVGVALSKYDGRKVILAGLIISAWSMFLMRGFTLEASYWDFVWPRVILGVGLAMLFVPLSTLTLGSIPKVEMGNAAGLYNLLRNVGGSVGIAVAATMLSRQTQFFQNVLVDGVTPYSQVARQKLLMLKQGFMLRGLDAASADKASLAAVYGMVQRQAGMLAYNRIFWIVGLTFLGVMPFLLLLRKQKIGAETEGVH
ncbi:DHA2 family efflux MFS transporter permease subunit [Geobacter hydrogenophilus]|uniref:EmrB/QacA family drug resistance transporter n=1 Tax=Geobacter hydrogenophilus TaxID=40983 RepID=A0A9W6LB11_9BACT|nr:DHA2 family efflux MFS transporter permease subunit [Geobacter hydrogenophilus]MBT0895189.1 DHA2 family efflux MFS transporter permease subunit [Geobacter hydrogenophilus]GLI36629.1 EmrB/QacA family drug resistance transporter [Geobacter hydrogenophilus]